MTQRFATCLGLLGVTSILFLMGPSRPQQGVAVAATDPPLTTTGGVVAADNAIASRVGARILARGGNAMDAAAATALALGVVNPSSSGIGGGGFAVIYVAREKKLYAIDFREIAPASLTPERFVVDGILKPELATSGGLAVGVPGEVAGLAHIVKRFGRTSWRRVVAPARMLAQRGFQTPWFTARAARSVTRRKPPKLHGIRLPWYTADALGKPAVAPTSRLGRWLSPGAPGHGPIREGQRVRRLELAATLARISRGGAKAFYSGVVAKDIVASVRNAGGVMTAKDLASYRVAERKPLMGVWRGHRIATMPLPSSGGLVMLEALGIVDATGVDLSRLEPHAASTLHILIEAMKHAFADRSRFLGDGDPAGIELGSMLDPTRLRGLAGRIRADRVGAHESYGDTGLGRSADAAARGGGTSHLCVVDSDGNAVAMTTTVNGYFGAKLMTKRGVVLNNQMDDFSLRSGVPNQFGLVQSDFNLVGPGKRPLSSMSPTLVLDGDAVVGCLGGSGGPRIISNTFQVLLNHFAFGMDAREAVQAPRFHHQWLPRTLYMEAAFSPDTVEALRNRGHKVNTYEWRRRPTSVQAIFVRPDGTLEAASDPRKRGSPAAAR